MRLNEKELDFIKQKALTMSDEEIGRELNRSYKTVRKARVRMGIKKGTSGKPLNVFTGEINRDEETRVIASHNLTEKQRQQFFRVQLTNSLHYDILKEQFTETELDLYLELWGSLCVQFEDIVITEKHQIDELIKTIIFGNRIARNIKLTELEIIKLQKSVKEIGDKADIENDVELQEKYDLLADLVQRLSGESSAMSNDYQKNQQMKNKLLSELNARRRDRIDHLTKAGTTFMGLVSAFREREVREKQGRYIELLKISQKKKGKSLRQEFVFPDGGEKDCLILDDQSQYVVDKHKSDVLVTKDYVKYYTECEDKKSILIVENNEFRIQLFQTIFKKHKISFASNVDKGLFLLRNQKFDLVCIDYDLGLEKKGSEIAKEIVDKALASDVIVHSENDNGVIEIRQILHFKDNTQFIRFKDILERSQNA